MHYLVMGRADRSPRDLALTQCRTIADGEFISFEQEWVLGAPLIARVNDGVRLEDIKAQIPAGCNAFAVEGLAEPGAGEAFLLGAHTMRDIGHFKSYADRVPDVVKKFGGRFLARASQVTRIAGDVVPDRVVITEYPSAADVVAFYVSDDYAPLLKLRLATVNARLVVMARSGALPDAARKRAEDYLRRRQGPAR
jgi:uncharacterized protein (DUF1330 family)